MALKQDELFNSAVGLGSQLRVIPKSIQPKEFGSGAGTIAKLQLVAFNTSTSKWVAWDPNAGTDEVATITADATPATAGTFTITVEGETTPAIAYDAAPAAVLTALLALEGIEAGDVAVAMTAGTDLGDASAVMQITFQGNLKGKALSVLADFSGLTGNAHVLAEATPGVDGNGANVARGFAWPDAITLDASDEVLRTVLLAGRVHRDDVPLAGETQSDVDAALASLRDKGFIVEGLAAFGS